MALFYYNKSSMTVYDNRLKSKEYASAIHAVKMSTESLIFCK